GLMVLLGVEDGDAIEDAKWLASKIVGLRIFEDADEKMNLSVVDVDGEVLVVSQFTLFGNVRKGYRPSFNRSARPDVAISLYEAFIAEIENITNKKVSHGEFGAMMSVSLINDGPVTIIIDSRDKNL
ncbi:MAG: D-tyrosyl-tRNA(Tyr) deacylase, partial [Opitutales bacterium]|nr:D-tyrosyl-tRNA(Tyr) deacylase [Opitutales bacterium]